MHGAEAGLQEEREALDERKPGQREQVAFSRSLEGNSRIEIGWKLKRGWVKRGSLRVGKTVPCLIAKKKMPEERESDYVAERKDEGPRDTSWSSAA